MGKILPSRREFLDRLIRGRALHQTNTIEAGFTPVESASSTITLEGGLNPYTGPWDATKAAHLLRRATFGVRKDQLNFMASLSNAEEAVNYVLNIPEGEPAPPVNNYESEDYHDQEVPEGKTWVMASYDDDIDFIRIESWRGWWLNRMIGSEANIQEKMTLFWHNHFSTRTVNVLVAREIYMHNRLLRKYALGNFKALVKAVTLDPTMLYFLNCYLNNKFAPDENYARELQELFTIGKDSPDHYTESDVVAAARVLTGWRVNYDDSSTYLDEDAHDTDDKQFSSFYGNAIIRGDLGGEGELDALLDLIFAKDEVALYICRKIYRFFIYYKIDAEIEANIIGPLAEIFRENNYEIYPVLEALLKSEHFFNAANTGCYIKNPLDLIVGTLRNFNLTIPASTLQEELYNQVTLNYLSSDMLMMPGDPPDVAGWLAYRQAPNYYRNWITTDTIRNRNKFTNTMCLSGYTAYDDILYIDHIAFVKQLDHPEDPVSLIEEELKIMLPVPVSEAKKNFLKNILLSGQANDYYWTQAWYNYINNPGDTAAYDAVYYRLAALHQYIMSLPEYQLI